MVTIIKENNKLYFTFGKTLYSHMREIKKILFFVFNLLYEKCSSKLYIKKRLLHTLLFFKIIL